MDQDIVIRASHPGDVPGLTALMNLPGFRHGTLRVPFESEESVRQRLFSPGSNAVSLVADRNGQIVGSAGLVPLARRRAHVGTIGMGVHDDWRRRGIGRALLTALLDVADNWLGLRRVELDVNVDNAAAIALYRSLGFEVEGTARQSVLRNGVLVDAHWMARLLPAPPAAGDRGSGRGPD